MIDKLDRYVSRIFLSSWLVSFVFFIGLYGVYEFFSKIDNLMEEVNQTDVGGEAVLYMYLYTLPAMLSRMAPFLMVVAVVITVMRLQRHNEFSAMVLVGRSPRRIVRPVIALTGVFLIGLVLMQEFLAPNVAIDRERLRARLIDHEEVWTIPRTMLLDSQSRMFIATDYVVEEQRIRTLSVSYRDEEGNDVHVTGSNATWDGPSRGWHLEEGTISVRDANGDTTDEPAAFVGRSIRPQDLLAEQLQPFDMSYGILLDMARRYSNHTRFRMLRHYHVTFPLAILLLVFMALHFTLQRDPAQRLRGLGMAILCCLAFLMLDAAMLKLGTSGSLSPVLAAWLPVIVAGSLVIVLNDGEET
ncbi:MAG: LptF/LptG family permease [Planctomycetota bacterium]|nr:LptF/LptG family permease [Planctomycetota bacterium]